MCAKAQSAESGSTARIQNPSGQTWSAPKTLAELLELLGQASTSGGSRPRLIAGNTGSGVYKNWPSAEDDLIDVTRVAEMREMRITQVRQFLFFWGLLQGGAHNFAESIM